MKGPTFVQTIVAGLIVGAVLLAAELWLSRPDAVVGQNASALEAQVLGGPWVPFPLEHTGTLERSWSRQGFSQRIIDEVARGDPWGFAQIVVRNTSSANVDSIRFNLGDYPPERVLIQRTGEALRELERPRELHLGMLEPGETLSIYFWHDYNLASRYYYYDWQTYSTAGQIRFRYGDDEPDDPVEFLMMQPEFPWFAGLLGLALLTILVGGVIEQYLHRRYARRLLSDGNFLEGEKERFAADPVTFQPKLLRRPGG